MFFLTILVLAVVLAQSAFLAGFMDSKSKVMPTPSNGHQIMVGRYYK